MGHVLIPIEQQKSKNKSNFIAWIECCFVQTFVAFMDAFHSQLYVCRNLLSIEIERIKFVFFFYGRHIFQTFVCNSFSLSRQ